MQKDGSNSTRGRYRRKSGRSGRVLRTSLREGLARTINWYRRQLTTADTGRTAMRVS
jgi:hypothetical protein